MADLMSPNGVLSGQSTRQEPKPPREHKTALDAAKALAWSGTLIEFYTYQDSEGRDVGLVARILRGNNKTMPQARCNGTTWFTGKGQSLPRPCPVYGLPALLAAQPDEAVLIPEGEKKVDLLRKLGFTAACTAMGAGSAKHSDLSPLRGRDVVLFADNDDAGRDHIGDLVRRLRTAGARSIRIAELPNLPVKGDICDWYADRIGSGANDELIAAELLAIVDNAIPAPVAAEPSTAEDIPTFPPFPLTALPAACRAIVSQGATAQGVDPAFYGVPALPILAGCIGNRRTVRVKPGWCEPSVIWAAPIALSGSGKSPPLRTLLQPVRQRDFEMHEQVLREQAHYEAVVRRIRADKCSKEELPAMPPMRAAIVDDCTLEALVVRLVDNPEGLLLANDELAGFLKSFNKYRAGDDEEKWLRIYGADALKTDRKGGSGHSSANRIYVPRAAVSIVGTIQPAIAAKYLSGELRESGLVARLLLAAPPVSPAKWTNATIDDCVTHNWGNLCRSLLDLTYDPDNQRVLPLEPEALDLFVAYHDDNGAATFEAAQRGDGNLAASLSKLRGYAPRLALVLALASAAEEGTAELLTAVSGEATAAGIELASYFEAESRRIYEQWSRATPEAHAVLDQRVLARLQEAEQPREQLRRKFARQGGANELTACLNRLRAAGLADYRTDDTGGRPAEVWRATS